MTIVPVRGKVGLAENFQFFLKKTGEICMFFVKTSNIPIGEAAEIMILGRDVLPIINWVCYN